jgi:hypothetical protein
VLWRVVYGRGSKVLTNFAAGPWHPDKEHVEHWAAWLRVHGQDVQVQSSNRAVSHLLGGRL